MIKNLTLIILIFLGSSSILSAKINNPCNGSCNNCEKNFSKEIDYEDALKKAKDNDCRVFLMFTGDHCSWCKKQKQVLSSDEVSKKMNDYVVCYIDASKNKQLSKKYKVSSLPKYFIIDKNENIIKEASGYKSINEFLSWLD